MNSKEVALKALIQASMYGLVVLLILLLLNATDVLLLVFAGVLIAVLLRGLAVWLAGKTGMPARAALVISIALPVLVVALAAWLLAPDVADQASQLSDRLPKALDRLRQYALQYDWMNRILRNRAHLERLLEGQSNSMELISGFFSSTFGALGNLVVALFIGLVLAIDPKLYMHGAVRLFPEHRRASARNTFIAIGSALQGWLIAKLTAMAVIGVLTALGLWLLGIELALVLGVIAAVLSFIPNFGPIAAVVPAALLALVSGPEKALYVLLLYAGIQTFESYVLTPALQQHMVDMPPALLITMQVLFGVLTGILGLILATPLTVAGMVAINRVYVEGLLEKKGERADTDDPGPG